MSHKIAPLPFKPPRLIGLSETSVAGHYQQVYGGALQQINRIRPESDVGIGPTQLAELTEYASLANTIALHEVYFDCLGGEDGLGSPAIDPVGEMAIAICDAFGTVEKWRSTFVALANAFEPRQSAWLVLAWSSREQQLVHTVVDGNGGISIDATPIVALDLFEHAYVQDFGSNRAAYIDAFVSNLHWGRPYTRLLDTRSHSPQKQNQPDDNALTPVSPETLAQWIAADRQLHIIDVCLTDDRSKRYDTLPNARFLVAEQMDQWVDQLPSDKPIIAYCMYGFQVSANAVAELQRRGLNARLLSGWHRWLASHWTKDAAIMIKNESPENASITPPAIGANGQPWPSLTEAFAVWTRIALLSFGGPAGQIAVMHRILVEEKRWLGEARFLHALNFCMLLPGPEAQQLAVYIGWLMHRTLGGLIAGILFIVPGVIAIMALSWIYALYGEVDIVAWLFFGLKAAVLAIVLNAVLRIGRRALHNNSMVVIAATSFIAIFFFQVPFPIIVVTAALVGYLGARVGLSNFNNTAGHGTGNSNQISDAQTILGTAIPNHAQSTDAPVVRTGVILLILWTLPTLLLIMTLGAQHVFSEIAVFFSKMAVVTFGGAYAVLAYVAQAAVDTHQWLEPGEMLDGLGMAETTPGPLIMVTQFVGFMGSFRNPGAMSALQAGTLGGLLTTWVTFTPCFLWIFLGAPHIERLREKRELSAALTAITAAVVGTVLNLAIWFAIHLIFSEVTVFTGMGLNVGLPTLSSISLPALTLSIIALLMVFRFKLGTATLLVIAALLGQAVGFAGWLN